MKNIAGVFFLIINITLFSFGCFNLFTSVQSIKKTGDIVKTEGINYGIIISITNPTRKGLERTVYFIVENDENIYRTNLITAFSKNKIEKGQRIHIKSDESKELNIIIDLLNETYANYIYGIITAVFCFTISILLFIKVLPILYRNIF